MAKLKTEFMNVYPAARYERKKGERKGMRKERPEKQLPKALKWPYFQEDA